MKKISITEYNPKYTNLPTAFDNFRIAVIADLHNANFKGKLEKSVKDNFPDIIVIVGDLINFEKRYTHALNFIKNAVKIAPVFYVNGNHEGRFKRYDLFRKILQDTGVILLENKTHTLTKGDSEITLIGINDPKFFVKPKGGSKKEEFKKTLVQICNQYKNDFKVLLVHRPEYFDFYVKCDIDLTLAGHTHGGQIRLPKIGALYAIGQGLLPKYAGGLKSQGEKYIVISKGFSQTFRTPPRVFNIRELAFVNLQVR